MPQNISGIPSIKRILQKWSIAFKVVPPVILIVGLKFLTHFTGMEVMELNALFTSLVAGTIFLLGFLISGVLSDYKESEKLPNEISISLKTLYDDTYTLSKIKNSTAANEFLDAQKVLGSIILDWFYKKVRTRTLLEEFSKMNQFVIDLDKEGVQVNYIIKLKNEQANLRKIILRIDTIRDTEFVSSAYAIVEAMGLVIAAGLIIIHIEPFLASLFFTILVTFLILYMIFLIKDLDNPFDYSHKGEKGTEISLKPIRDHIATLAD
ncbi:MAG: hypothetical protein ABI844_08425 [Saprospiraceae bacterium]